MIAEPCICIKGEEVGKIEWWLETSGKPPKGWQRYADFEREKLVSIAMAMEEDPDECFIEWAGDVYHFTACTETADVLYDSEDLIGYSGYIEDTESNRLLKRAEFLKAVCEAENVPWLDQRCDACKEAEVPDDGQCKYHNSYTKQEIESALDQMERRIDMKASRLIAMQRDALYSKEEIDELLKELAAIIRAFGRVKLTGKNKNGFTDAIDEFVSRFLP